MFGIATVVSGKDYQDFIPLFIYGVHRAYPEYHVEVYCKERLKRAVSRSLVSLEGGGSFSVHENTLSEYPNVKDNIKACRWLFNSRDSGVCSPSPPTIISLRSRFLFRWAVASSSLSIPFKAANLPTYRRTDSSGSRPSCSLARALPTGRKRSRSTPQGTTPTASRGTPQNRMRCSFSLSDAARIRSQSAASCFSVVIRSSGSTCR